RTITHLLQYRYSASISLSPAYTVRFGLEGGTCTAGCLEMSNFGATLLLPPDAPLALFPPGTALESLQMEREGKLVFRAAWAQVQRAQPMLDEPRPHLRLGVSWATAMNHPPQAPSVMMEEPSEVLATLRKALRREVVLWLQLEGSSSLQIRLESPVLEVLNGIAVLQGQSTGRMAGSVGDVVHLSFEMGGQSYLGMCSLLVDEPDGRVVVRLPRALSIRNWRSLPRFKPRPGDRFLISFEAPVTGQHTTRAVLDLGVGGLSFPFDASSEILPAGSQLDASLLLPDGTSAACQMEVRSIHVLPSQDPVDGGLRTFRAGARFISIPQRARDAILQSFMIARCPSIQDGSFVPFEDIWQVMEAARYRFHPDYPFEDAPLALLEETHRKLYATQDLGRCLVYRSEDELRGHIAGLRIHSRTWLVQHLAVRPGFRRNEQVSYELSNLIVELGEVQQDIEFIRYSWRKDNRWPSRRMGWLARAMETPGLSLLRNFSYMRLCLAAGLPAPPPGLPRVRAAELCDRVWLERHLRSRGEMVRVLCEDLQADEVELKGLEARFREHGLLRRRRLFVVDGEQAPLALCLVEEASPGLNLIEKTNAFWLVVPDRAHPQARQAVRALVQHAVELAQARGRPSAIACVDDEEIELLQEAGFEHLGRFCEWIFHRSMIRRGCELWRSMFERLGGTPAPEWGAEEGEQ
ncbi:MAG TPA: PilZ domain-containing protein, partial [Myxococcaceae bacterium]|nr:PilZ domain-containing protein [Myxococcaceae bacterium]